MSIRVRLTFWYAAVLAISLAVFSVVLQSAMVGSVAVHAREIPSFPPAAQKVLVEYVAAGGLYGVPDSGENGLGAQLGRTMKPTADTAAGIDLAMKRAFTDGINVTFLMAALIGMGAVAVAFFVEGKRRVRRGAKQVAPVDDLAGEPVAAGE